MKRIVLLFAVMSLPLILCAQPGRPRPEDLSDEEFVRMQTRDMADRLGLEGETRNSFISTYGAFRGEINALAAEARSAEKAETEDEIDRTMRMNFEVSGKMLEIRKRYYEAFRKFLQPSQIRQMYRFENEAGQRMHGGHAGPDGPGKPDEPGHHGPEHFRMGPPPRM